MVLNSLAVLGRLQSSNRSLHLLGRKLGAFSFQELSERRGIRALQITQGPQTLARDQRQTEFVVGVVIVTRLKGKVLVTIPAGREVDNQHRTQQRKQERSAYRAR